VVAGFFLTSFNLESIERTFLGVPERLQFEQNGDPEREEAHRLAVGNRQALGAMAVFLLAAGYTLFVVSVSRETRRRAAVEAEIQLARSVHDALVPKKGVRTGWCVADGWSIPAAKIGGDVFEFVLPTPDQLVVFVADASGHGVGAGLVAAMTKGLLVHDIARSGSPADLLTSVNATLFRLTERNVFVTAAAAIVDRRRGEVEVSTAGHPAVLHRRSDGTTEALRTPSVPLGASPSTLYRVERRTWRAEDRLAFYSDGLTEARDSGGMEFGSERLADLLTAADPLNAVREAFEQHVGSHQRADDVTFVLVTASAG
jgi:sigma-B regulation protein RsbU (phosphoserine phosphatase)/two-component system sensor histidine kinase ChiS